MSSLHPIQRSSDRRLRRGRQALAAAILAVAAVLASGCVSPQPRATAGTSTSVLASSSFCDPLRSLSVDLWVTTGSREAAAADLARARGHAPAGMHEVLDTLHELERAGVHPGASDADTDVEPQPQAEADAGEGTGGASTGTDAGGGGAGGASSGTGAGAGPAEPPSTAPALDRWFEALNALSDVAQRECGVDLAAGMADVADGAGGTDDDPDGSTVGAGRTPTPAVDGSFDDVLDLVRAARPAATWVEQDLVESVSTGDAVTVSIAGVDDAAVAMGICADLLAVLPTLVDPPSVTVRNTTGFVIVAGEGTECIEIGTP